MADAHWLMHTLLAVGNGVNLQTYNLNRPQSRHIIY